MIQETTLALDASRYTTAQSLQGRRRVAAKVYIATGDAEGVFYLVTRVTPSAGWDRHPVHFAPKTAGNSLTWRVDWPENCGHEIAIEWAKSTGGADQTANVFLCLD